jgi:lysozyme
MHTGFYGLHLLMRWEGCKLKVYLDVAKKRTVGWGHLLRPGDFYPNDEITQAQADAVLAQDLVPGEQSIERCITVPLGVNQQGALSCFLYNVGAGALVTSAIRTAINQGRMADVPPLLEQWCHVTVDGVSVVNKGLLSRRRSEGTLWMTPDEDHATVEGVLTAVDKAIAEGLIARTTSEEVHALQDELRTEAFDRYLAELDVPLVAPKSPWDRVLHWFGG